MKHAIALLITVATLGKTATSPVAYHGLLKLVGAPGEIFQGLHPLLIMRHALLIMQKKFASRGLAQALLQAGKTLADASGDLRAQMSREHDGGQLRVGWQRQSFGLGSGRPQGLGL